VPGVASALKAGFDPVDATPAQAARGLTLLLTAMGVCLPPVLHAADGPSPEINALNTMWVLIAAFLVACMQVGLVILEAGFARSRESINILVEGIVDTCICGVLFWP
jgi:Amt family ammonium transporter